MALEDMIVLAEAKFRSYFIQNIIEQFSLLYELISVMYSMCVIYSSSNAWLF